MVMEVEAQLEAHTASPDVWRQALARVVPAVVVLRVTVVRAFDTEVASSSYATGFVVDKKRGIILTNRHVAKPGPIVAEAMFLNREEVPVQPIYRDPVHDFGFFHFNPSAIQFLQFEDIPLSPQAAAVGLEVRVVGNDSGEKVSILQGTLARLDREAPVYKKDGYNDFNTFYFQAASGTKGGSSGSPVIDSRGHAVALNAGSKTSSASAFFLPLDRIVRALEAIRQCFDVSLDVTPVPHNAASGGSGGAATAHDAQPSAHAAVTAIADAPVAATSASAGSSLQGVDVDGGSEGDKGTLRWWKPPVVPRGTLQTTVIHRGYDETRRLGLQRSTEQEVRLAAGPSETGLLVVDSVVPGGPADGQLEPGDVLVRCNGKVLTAFLPLEEILDNSVGKTITLDVERGGKPLSLSFSVQDLHSITPSLFLEISSAVVHSLSYQQARNFRIPCGRVYVSDPGYMFSRAGVPRHAIIQKLAGSETANLEEFIEAMRKLPPGARVPVEYVTYNEKHRPKSVLLTVDRYPWNSPPKIYKRGDATGLWHITPAFPLSPAPALPAAAGTAFAAALEPVELRGGYTSSISHTICTAPTTTTVTAVGAPAVAVSHHGKAALGHSMTGEEVVGSEREEGKRDIGEVTEESVTEAKRMRTALDATALEDGGGVQKLPSMADLNEAASLIAEEAVEEKGKAAGEGEEETSLAGSALGVVGDGFSRGVVESGIGADELQDKADLSRGAVLQSGGAEEEQRNGVSKGDAPDMTGVNGVVEAEEGMVGEEGQQVATSGVERLLEPSLVMMDVHVPSNVLIDGVYAQHFFGTALVLHHSPSLGLLVVDRNTVAVSVSDIMLSFCAYPVEVPGEVVFLHPVHNFAIVAYDPSALGSAAYESVKAATLAPGPPLLAGDKVHLVGMSRSQQVTSRQSVVTNPTASLNAGAADCPRYRAINMDLIEIDTDFGQSFSGALTDACGRVRALWCSFSTSVKYSDGGSEDMQFVRGMPISFIQDTLQAILTAPSTPLSPSSLTPSFHPTARPPLPPSHPHPATNSHPPHSVASAPGCQSGGVLIPRPSLGPTAWDGAEPLLLNGRLVHLPGVAVLEAELTAMRLSKARSFGLSDAWVQVLAKADPVRRQVLRVKGTFAGSAAEQQLKEGDMILSVDGKPVTCFADVEGACKALAGGREGKEGGKERGEGSSSEIASTLGLTILRQSQELHVRVGTGSRHGFGTTRVVNWAGCLVQEPHPAVRAAGFLPSQGHGAYIARWCHGSPAHRYGLYALHWIVEINGQPVPDLDALVALTQKLEHGAFVRMKVVHLNGKPKVLTLKQDLHYWPTWELRFVPHLATWRRYELTERQEVQ